MTANLSKPLVEVWFKDAAAMSPEARATVAQWLRDVAADLLKNADRWSPGYTAGWYLKQ